MNVVELPNTEPMGCPREDVASDSVTGVRFSLCWGLCGHQVHALTPPPGGATEGHGGQKMKVGISAQFCLVLCLGDLRVPMHQYWELYCLLGDHTPLDHVSPIGPSLGPPGA